MKHVTLWCTYLVYNSLHGSYYCKAYEHEITDGFHCAGCTIADDPLNFNRRPSRSLWKLEETKTEEEEMPTRINVDYGSFFGGLSDIRMMPINNEEASKMYRDQIDKVKKVIFNHPATIILWDDGTKTVVHCGDDEKFDPEKGIAMCLLKKMLGNKGDYNNYIRHLIAKGEQSL